MQFYADLTAGEGLSGPADIGMGTSPIYSCMGIAFVNSAKQMGGLFHYPAEDLAGAATASTIQQMINDVKPDEIHVTPAANASGMLNDGSKPADLAAVIAYLKLAGGGAKVIQEAAGGGAYLYWKAGKPVFNQYPGEAGTATSAGSMVPAAIRGAASMKPRQVAGNVWYYGMAENLNAAAPPKPAKCCTIL
jgi:hypothetical protein